jgi:hypothetical protein
MIRTAILVVGCVAAPVLRGQAVAPVRIHAAASLPLALDDSYRIEKVFSLLIDPSVADAPKARGGKGVSPWFKMETERRYFGALNSFERRLRDGHSYTVHWGARPTAPAGLTVRFEYRQQKLGSQVQAQEVSYAKVSGSMRTEFTVQGDEYYQDGQVTAWRVLLVESGRVVGLQQSFLW